MEILLLHRARWEVEFELWILNLAGDVEAIEKNIGEHAVWMARCRLH